MTPVKSRAARELLGLSQEQLAEMADLSLSTVQDLELGRPLHDCLVATIQVALEAAGVDFAGGDGIRLRKDERV
jgi:transcriptional regulator with XRE-family HTH domain